MLFAAYGYSTIRYQPSLMLAADISRTNVSRGMTYRVPDLRRCNFGLTDDFFEISLDIVTERASAAVITVHIWPLSVTESLELPPKTGRSPCPTSGNSIFVSGSYLQYWCRSSWV